MGFFVLFLRCSEFFSIFHCLFCLFYFVFIYRTNILPINLERRNGMTKNLHQISNYIASNSTFCLISHPHRSKVHTIISDKHGKVIYPNKPLKIIRNTCRLHGSSYEASNYNAKLFFGKSKHKLPIMVAYDFGDPCILFPLFSPHSSQNIWISLHAIVNINELGNETIVTFIDGSEERLPIHMKSFNHQYVRAAMYYKHLITKRNSKL